MTRVTALLVSINLFIDFEAWPARGRRCIIAKNATWPRVKIKFTSFSRQGPRHLCSPFRHLGVVWEGGCRTR